MATEGLHRCSSITVETAEIVVTGFEITSGKTLDTNSHVITRYLHDVGIECLYISTVGDDRERLEAAYRTALSRVDLVISCGGLGPTDDDLSMELAALSSGLPLEKNRFCEEHIRACFAGRDIPLSDNNWKQAYLPRGAEVLPNDRGTACGAVFTIDFDGKARQFALLPGPPGEMEQMLKKYLLPKLKSESTHQLRTLTFRTVGLGESSLEMKLLDLIREQKEVAIATYAGQGEVLVRVSKNENGAGNTHAFEEVCEEIRNRLGRYIFEEGERGLAEVVIDLLRSKKMRVSFAESCTAGLLSSEIVSISGASDVFSGSFVTYSNEMKEKILSIPAELLEEEGAVSALCAEAMAKAARRLSGSDIGVAVTGYAGPGGGNEKDPVGTMYIGLSDGQVTLSERHSFNSERNQNRRRAVTRSLDFLRRFLQNKEDLN